MNGELAQRMSLVAWGNEALAGRAHPEFADHDTFRFVHSATFSPVRQRRFRTARPTTSASAWIEELKSSGVERLELDALGQLIRPGNDGLAGHLTAAFANGVSTPIVAARADEASIWRASWSVAAGERPADNRIWVVTYENVSDIARPTLQHPTITAATAHLGDALQAIHRFAISHDTGHWVAWFEEALALLNSPAPATPYYAEFLPDRGLAHSQLTSCAVKAWVFGGMGSWNDLGFFGDDAQHEYEQVTSRLFNAVMEAVDAAANATG